MSVPYIVNNQQMGGNNMYKRVVAGIAALLMLSSAAPLPEIAQFLPIPSSTITAEAANASYSGTFGKYSKSSVAYVEKTSFTITLDSEDMPTYFSNTDSTVTVTDSIMKKICDDCVAALKAKNTKLTTVDYSNCEIIFKGAFTTGKFPNLAHVVFRDSYIDTIQGCFQSMTNLQTVDLGTHITTIGSSTFYNCSGAFVGSDSNNTLKLGNVTNIGQYAFQNCKLLEHIEFNTATTTIDKSAFSGCSSLKEVSFPKAIESIGDSAFASCTQMTTVKFADASAIDYIGTSAFSGDSSLSSVDFGNKTTVSVIAGSTFQNCTSLATVKANGVSNTLPDGIRITRFGTSMFLGCTSLRNFTWPAYLCGIPAYTFQKCSSLSKVVFGDESGNSAKLEYIGQYAFDHCSLLNNVVLPQSTERVLQGAFAYCDILENCIVSDNLKMLDGTATISYFNASSEADIEKKIQDLIDKKNNLTYIDTEVTDDGKYIVYYVNELHNVKANCVDEHNRLNGGVFANDPLLAVYPRSKMNSAHTVPAGFANKVMLPDTVEYVPESTFSNCTGLVGVTLGKNTKSVGDYCFRNCTSLTNVTLPDGVTVLNDYVFDGCSALTDVVYSKNLSTIYGYAFRNCKLLATATPSDKTKIANTIQFPATCGGVQNFAFNGCETFKYLNFIKDSSGATNFATVGASSFKGCKSLTGMIDNGKPVDTISLPEKVNAVQQSAFENCTSIVYMILLGNVTTLGDSAFSGCESMKSITVNTSLRQVGASAFKNCKSLENMPRDNSGNNSLANLTVINSSTFEGCTALKSAEIPANITSIGSRAFSGCSNMTKVTVASGSKLLEIGANAFQKCNNLALFTDKTDATISYFPASVVTINQYAFDNTALKSIKIVKPSSGVTNVINQYAFSNNTALETVDLSESNIAKIDNYLFYSDTNLKTVYLPTSTVSSIGNSAFSYCYYLHTFGTKSSAKNEFVIPESVTAIGSKAFENNYCMQKITFPSKTTSIDITMFNFNIKETEITEKGYTPIEYITVNPLNTNYSSANGVLFNKNKTVLMYYPYRMKGDYYTVPDTVTEISASAFSSNRYLKGVILDRALTTISDKAFYNTASLDFIDFGNNTTVTLPKNAQAISPSTNGKKITLYGEAPSTAATYADTYKNYVVFQASASTLNILDEKGNAVDSIRIPNSPATYQLGAQQLDGSGKETQEKLVWASENESVATVDQNGLVTFKSTGKANIVLKNEKGSLDDKIEFSIFQKPVITLDGKSFTYTGSAIKPGVKVVSGDVTLSEGVDYTVSYSNNINAGTAKVTINGQGNYPFTDTATFTITAKSIAGCKIKPQYSSYTYTGSAIKPVITVTDTDGKVLVEGTDYTVAFTNNIKVGQADIKVTGRGKYSGTISSTFVVKPAKNAATLSNYNGGIKVKFNKGTEGTVGYQIVYCKDKNFPTDDKTYHTTTVDAKKNQLYVNLTSVPKPGETWYVKVRSFYTKDGKLTSSRYGNYSAVKTITVKQPLKSVSIPYSSYTYNGKAQKPTVTVKDSAGKKVPTTGYTVSYSNNTKIGQATITITGKGSYAGTIKKTFIIKPKKNSITSLSSASGKMTVKWKKADAGTTGYQIQYAKDKNFSNNLHSTTVTSLSTLSKTISSYIKKGETWYVRVRSFVTADGKTTSTRYGNYSDVKTVKIN